MNIAMILEMAASAGDRVVVTAGDRSLTASGLLRLAHAAAHRFRDRPAVLYLGANHLAYPVALFGASLAGVPFVPLNYRLGDHQSADLQGRHPGALVLRPADLDALVEPAETSAQPPLTGARERITHALLVPTMLARVVAEVRGDDAGTPTLRTLAYGGVRTLRPVLERALQVFPGTGFVNAYGLTETASSIAVLGPGDHRKSLASDDPEVRARLGSVGRALPGIEFQIRTQDGEPAEIRQGVKGRLRGSKTPDDVVILDELPTTPTGKILRRRLVELVRAGADASADG